MSSSRSALPELDSLVSVGIIRKAHGVRGEASVESLTSSPERFSELDEVFLVAPEGASIQPARILSARAHGDRALVRFDVIDSPEKVRDFQNWTVDVLEENARELEEGEYFIHDLVGLSAFSPSGEIVGEIADAMETPGGLLLSVRRPSGSTFDLPFAASICTAIDLENRRMTVELPEGLEDLEGVVPVEELPVGTAPASEPEPEPLPEPSLTVDIVTIFPRMFDSFLAEGVVSRGIRSNILSIVPRDLRDYTTDRHRSTDDEAYGGGAGMVMLAEPVIRCVEAITEERGKRPWVVMTSPQGRVFDQEIARELAGKGTLVVLCGRYEGFDERIREAVVDEELSIGDFVVSGGELPAMLIVDAVARMIEGVVGQRNSVEEDSFYNGLLDYPHYTRPAELRGMRVPEVLLSGHAEKIRQWRKEQALRNTLRKRADLLEKVELDSEGAKMLARIRSEEGRSE
jgi:tRNA (guanine37-N1)-methyltransferase